MGRVKGKAKPKVAGDVTMDEAAATTSATTLASHLELQRTRVICGPDINYNVSVI